MANDTSIAKRSSSTNDDNYADEKGPRDVEKVSVSKDDSGSDSITLTPHLYEEGELDPVYYAKTLVLNRAIQEIGMGKYQVRYLSVCLLVQLFSQIFPVPLSICYSSLLGLDGLRK